MDNKEKIKNSKVKTLLLLHIMLMVYSMSGICSKKAATATFLSFDFCLYYGIVIMLLGIYAIVWQQIIKMMPLTTAFANKAVTIIWGIIWGALFFSEKITIGKIIGALFVIIGVVLFAYSDNKESNQDEIIKNNSLTRNSEDNE